jgi:hypothetical protein
VTTPLRLRSGFSDQHPHRDAYRLKAPSRLKSAPYADADDILPKSVSLGTFNIVSVKVQTGAYSGRGTCRHEAPREVYASTFV